MASFAIDFDGTCFKWTEFPNIGEPVPGAMETLKLLKAHGHELILWTCRKGESLQMAIDKLAEHGVEFDFHNEHPDQDHLSYKLDADFFIDDKSVGCPLRFDRKIDLKPWVNWQEIQEILAYEGIIDDVEYIYGEE